MKKRSLLIMLFVPAVMLGMFSCGKEDLPDPKVRKIAFFRPQAVLKEMQVSQIVFSGHVYDFYYGSNGKPEKVSGFYESEKNADGISYKAEEEFILVYAGELLKEVNKEFIYTRNLPDGTQELENGTSKVTYIYNDKGLVGEVQKIFFTKLPDDSYGETTFSHQYEYDKDNKVVKITDFGRGQKLSAYNTLEWNGGNLVKQTLFYEPDGEGQRKLRGSGNENSGFMKMNAALADESGEEVVFNDYDDKINPMLLFAVLYGGSPGITQTENNAGKVFNYVTDENGQLVERQLTTIDHTYDSTGRPTRYKVSTTVHELDQTYDMEYIFKYKD